MKFCVCFPLLSFGLLIERVLPKNSHRFSQIQHVDHLQNKRFVFFNSFTPGESLNHNNK